MKKGLRIVVPVVAAVVVVGGLIGFLLLQVSTASQFFQRTAQNRAELNADIFDDAVPSAENDPLPSGDQALLHLRQGDLLALENNWAGAEREYAASADAGGGIPALRKLAQAQLQRHNLEGARNTVDRLKREGAKAEDLLLLDVILQLRSGELEKARTLLTEAPDSPHKQYGLGLLALIQGQHDEAKTQLTAVTQGWEPVLRSYAKTLLTAYDEYALFPQSRPIHLQTLLARNLAQVQECELALPLLQGVVQEQDDYRDAWILHGYCSFATERFDRALSSLERAYALDPEKPEIQYFLGRTYAALQDHGNAITFLQYALKNGFKPEREVRRAIALEAQATNDTALALAQYKGMAEAEDATVAHVRTYVSMAVNADQKEAAYTAAVGATQRWPESADAYELLGWTSAQLDKKEEAKAALEKALELDPGRESARQALLLL